MATTRYLQLGGHRGNITSTRSQYDEKDVANTIAGPSSPLRLASNPIELVLGIKESGTSHLLLTREQYNSFITQRGPPALRCYGGEVSARDFESMSPIYFESSEALAKKMSSLKPKPGKGSRDTSQANKMYDPNGREIHRGAFEHGRVLYRILNGQITDTTKFGCYDTSWTRGLRVASLIFNVKSVDGRSRKDRVENPHVLDVGFCYATLPSMVPDSPTCHHIINRRNVLLDKRTPFTHGVSETTDIESRENDRVKTLFADHKNRNPNPLILLIYNEEATVAFLRRMNVDISVWVFNDLKDLMFAGSSNQRSFYNDRDRPHTGRSRSRSPSRRRPDPGSQNYPGFQSNRGSRDYRSTGPSFSSHNRPNETTKLYSPVYVVDLEPIYNKLMSNNQVKSLRQVAEHLLNANIQGKCAGNEAVMAIELWKEMISGPPIDEQRELRLKGAEHSETPGTSSSAAAGPSSGIPTQSQLADWDSEDEQDPNDYVPPPKGGAPSIKPQPGKHKKTLSESDYGGSSSDSD